MQSSVSREAVVRQSSGRFQAVARLLGSVYYWPLINFQFQVLGLNPDANPEEIKKAYHKLSLKNHPDKNPENAEAATEAFQKIQQAHEKLTDPKNKYMGSSTYKDRNRYPFTYMDFDAIRRYKESYSSCFPKYSNYKDSYSDPNNPKNQYSTPLSDSYRHSFTNVNSDSNNPKNKSSTYTDSYSDSNNPKNKYSTYTDSFTNVNSDSNNSENQYFNFTDSYFEPNNPENKYSTNENSANPNKNSGFFIYEESPLLYDEVTHTFRRNPKSRPFTYTDPYIIVDSDIKDIWPQETHSSYWPK